MINNFYVSISLVLGDANMRKKDLITFPSLEELDSYTISFSNSSEIRNKYSKEIQEYLRKNIEYLTNQKQKEGRIVITYLDNYSNIRYFPIIYSNEQELLNIDKTLKIIKDKLTDNNILKDISVRKSYLLSRNEKDLLNIYFSTNNLKYKKDFIIFFINRLSSSKNKYLYVRSLLNVCKLMGKKGKIQQDYDDKNSITSNNEYIKKLKK